MCGRYASTRDDKALVAAFDVSEVVDPPPGPSWNVAPTQTVRTVLERPPRDEPDGPAVRSLRSCRWGLVPSWAKDPKIGNKLVNARSETILDKPAFKAAARRRRCILPADGYYEWMPTEAGKVPYFLHLPDQELLAMAGLYELWPDPELPEDDPDRWRWSCTVLATSATDTLGHIHDRSPVVLPPGDAQTAWLDPTLTEPDDIRALLAALPEPHLTPREVSTAVNSVRNNGPHLLDPVGT